MKEYRIKEENKKFYPERYIKCIISGYWTNQWPMIYILGEWCGSLITFEFDTLIECEKFLDNRFIKYYNVKKYEKRS